MGFVTCRRAGVVVSPSCLRFPPRRVFGQNQIVRLPSYIHRRVEHVALALSLIVTCSSDVAHAQINPRVALLEQAGWKALDAGQTEVAARAFREALAEDAKSPRLRLGLAFAAFAQRKDSEAKAALEQALALEPTLPGARELLGRVLYRTGDLDGAIRVYSALLAGKSADHPLVQLHDRWRREADLRDRMSVAVGSGFTVAFEGEEDAALASQALASLERASTRIGALLGVYPLAPVPVVLYTGEQFRDITRAPQWAGGAFDGTIRVPMRGALNDPRELDRVLAHEFAHALVHTLAPRGVPTWLNEGLAAALEHDPIDGSKTAPTVEPPALIPLGRLGTSFGPLSAADAQRAYATSAFAVRRLLDEAGGVAIANLLRDIGSGENFDAAFSRRMPRSLDDFQSSLAR